MMNHDEEEIELLDDSFDMPSAKENTDVENLESKNQSDVLVEKEMSEEVMVSPLLAKTNIVGTTASSPRVSLDDTFATTSSRKSNSTHLLNDNKTEENKVEKTDDNDLNHMSSVSDVKKEDTKSNKPIVLIGAFVLLLITIMVLPYSQKLFDHLFPGKQNEIEDSVITNGRLVCTMESEDGANSFQYTETYSFDNSEVSSMAHEVLIQGDADYLNQRSNMCKQLKTHSSSLSGVTVNCKLSGDEMVETQSFQLSRFDSSSLTAAFSEAGGVAPNAKQGEHYEEIKRVMEISGYECDIK